MSNHRQATDPGPSLVSIAVMTVATLVTIATAVWIAWGATDERHVVGVALSMLLAVLMTAHTIMRASERAVALERRAARRRRYDERENRQRIESAIVDGGTPVAPPAGEETQVIRIGPSSAADARIGVPVFRNEAERARWVGAQRAERSAWTGDSTEVAIQDGTRWPA
jgi:hypothetical protein